MKFTIQNLKDRSKTLRIFSLESKLKINEIKKINQHNAIKIH